jgi:site-specific DNA recombinase
MEKKLKFFSYCRGSTVDQQITISDQTDKIRNFCNYKGYELVENFIDSGVSGSTNARDRPEMKKLLDRLTRKEADGLICSKIDRLSRSSGDFINIMNYFNRNNIQLIFLEPEIDTRTPIGKMILTIMSSVAELELNMIRQRTKDALKKKKEKGESYGQTPYGKTKTEDKKLIDNLEEQKNITLIIKLYNNGMSVKEICKKLIDDNVERKPNNAKWFPTQINRILKENNINRREKKNYIN